MHPVGCSRWQRGARGRRRRGQRSGLRVVLGRLAGALEEEAEHPAVQHDREHEEGKRERRRKKKKKKKGY